MISNEVLIAIIGVIGVLVTAVFSNWDKLFSKKGKIVATFSGYRSTGVFETELRYYFEVSGTRKLMDNMTQQMLQNIKRFKIQENPENSDEIEKVFEILMQETLSLDEVIKKLLPVYQNYFSIEELQELNKFYSTKLMQDMIKKNSALAIEAAPMQIEIINNHNSRVNKILADKLNL